MPKVGNKKYPYTKKGMAQAKASEAKQGDKKPKKRTMMSKRG